MNVNNQVRIRIGATAWAFSLQYYVLQIIVSRGWPTNHSYNWAVNTISDLGNTVCGQYGDRLVCSPRHTFMNFSFIALGSAMIIGTFFLYQGFTRTKSTAVGFGSMLVAGTGTVLVGLVPENSLNSLHLSGAASGIVIGNIGMLVLGRSLVWLPNWLRKCGVLGGVVGLASIVLFATHNYLGIGGGAVERIAAYPQSLWMITVGTYLLLVTAHPKSARANLRTEP